MSGLIIIIIIIAVVIIFFIASKYDVKMRGIKTTGKVTNVNSRTRVDQYGVSHTTYYITYTFDDNTGQSWSGEGTSSSSRYSIGSAITVYYLPKRPSRNVADL